MDRKSLYELRVWVIWGLGRVLEGENRKCKGFEVDISLEWFRNSDVYR